MFNDYTLNIYYDYYTICVYELLNGVFTLFIWSVSQHHPLISHPVFRLEIELKNPLQNIKYSPLLLVDLLLPPNLNGSNRNYYSRSLIVYISRWLLVTDRWVGRRVL